MKYMVSLIAIVFFVKSTCAGSHDLTMGYANQEPALNTQNDTWNRLKFTPSVQGNTLKRKRDIGRVTKTNLTLNLTLTEGLNMTIDSIVIDTSDEPADMMNFISIFSLFLNLALLSILN